MSGPPETAGRIFRSARFYDLRLWARSVGRERGFREEQVDLARLAAGECVLDIGCGTGTLGIVAKRRVGPSGAVHGIDVSPGMIVRARRKARRAGADVVFETARAQELPFPDATFDAVLVTLTLHHLPTAALHECVSEIRRVLKPAGRLLAVDIGGPQDGRRTPHAHHGRVHWDLDALVPLLAHAGLNEVESGAVEFRLARFERLRYVLAAAA